MNTKLKTIDEFFKANAIQINETKTSFMLLTSKGGSKDLPCSVLYRNKELKQVNELKFLGVYIDANLKFKKHTETIIITLRQYVRISLYFIE